LFIVLTGILVMSMQSEQDCHHQAPQRHGLATKIKATTGDTLAASGMLRRSDVATTERNYIHTVSENTRKAMQTIERETVDAIERRKSVCGKSVATEVPSSEDAA
jgi:hypothetical protein